jgi:hypothetical protein
MSAGERTALCTKMRGAIKATRRMRVYSWALQNRAGGVRNEEAGPLPTLQKASPAASTGAEFTPSI